MKDDAEEEYEQEVEVEVDPEPVAVPKQGYRKTLVRSRDPCPLLPA